MTEQQKRIIIKIAFATFIVGMFIGAFVAMNK